MNTNRNLKYYSCFIGAKTALAKVILFYSLGGALADATVNVYGFQRWLIRSQINDL
jgi:hypothetical protein